MVAAAGVAVAVVLMDAGGVGGQPRSNHRSRLLHLATPRPRRRWAGLECGRKICHGRRAGRPKGGGVGDQRTRGRGVPTPSLPFHGRCPVGRGTGGGGAKTHGSAASGTAAQPGTAPRGGRSNSGGGGAKGRGAKKCTRPRRRGGGGAGTLSARPLEGSAPLQALAPSTRLGGPTRESQG